MLWQFSTDFGVIFSRLLSKYFPYIWTTLFAYIWHPIPFPYLGLFFLMTKFLPLMINPFVLRISLVFFKSKFSFFLLPLLFHFFISSAFHSSFFFSAIFFCFFLSLHISPLSLFAYVCLSLWHPSSYWYDFSYFFSPPFIDTLYLADIFGMFCYLYLDMYLKISLL